MRIRPLTEQDGPEWLRMRCALWPSASRQDLEAELGEYLEGSPAKAVLVAARPDGGLGGFIELSLRPWVEGCCSTPVGYIEGWYVDADLRRRRIGAELVAAAEQWARAQGCREMGSDVEVTNSISLLAHAALGYREVERVVAFAKRL